MNNASIKKFIEEKKESGYKMSLLNRENALLLIELLHDKGIRIFGFDGFIRIKKDNYRIEQDFSRDYSRFSSEDAYLLIKEYFLKLNEDDVMYDISFEEVK